MLCSEIVKLRNPFLYFNEVSEYMSINNIFDKIKELTLKKSELCAFGQYCRAFLERDVVMTGELFPCLDSLIKNESFQRRILTLFTNKNNSEKCRLLEKIEECKSSMRSSDFYDLQLPSIEEKLKVNSFSLLLAHFASTSKSNQGMIEMLQKDYTSIHGFEDNSYIDENYTLYCLGNILYDDFLYMKGRTELLEQIGSLHVYEEYKSIDIELDNVDPQFLKYKLLSKNEYITINNDKDSQTITDSRIGKFFWINIPQKLLSSIQELIDSNCIKNISFRIDGVSESLPAMEEMAFGEKLKINVSELPILSKFYSEKEYNDNLWVRHDLNKKSLTFEELTDNFEIFNDCVVTQVIHLEYKCENKDFYISHLDHEFIVYTMDEYYKRTSSSDHKGHKKIKTFKIDNSKIPFLYKPKGEYFLYQVLDAYLINKGLVSEYFENVVQESKKLPEPIVS